MQRHLSALRRAPSAAAPDTAPPAVQRLREAVPVDLESLRLVLRQHLEELRLRGVPESVLSPVEEELRHYSQTIEELTRATQP